MMLASISTLMTYMFPIAGCMLLSYGIFQIVADTKSAGNRRVQQRLKGQSGKNEKKQDAVKLRRNLGEGSGFADAMLGKFAVMKRIQGMLDQADIDWAAPSMMLNLGLGAFVLSILMFMFQVSLLAIVGCAGAIMVMPLAVIAYMRKSRLKKLTNQLPDVFEMMSQALRAGHSLASAIQLVHEQMPNPISSEFGRVYHEQNLGMKIEDALVSMADRLDLLDVKFFVTAVLIQRQTGGDLSEVIDNIGGVIRSRIELFGLVQGLTAEGRLSGWVLFALPFLVFFACMYLNPAYAQVLLEDPTGKFMLMGAGGLQLMGIAMIRWIVNIKV